MANPFVQYDNIIPLLAPVDITTTATASNYMDLKTAHKAGFLLVFGAFTGTATDDAEVITVEAATAPGGTEAAVAFRYRISGAVGDNTWGAIATADTTGLSLNTDTYADMAVWIEVDPDEMAANDYRYVRVVATAASAITACVVGAYGVLDARYKQTTYKSATASASA